MKRHTAKETVTSNFLDLDAIGSLVVSTYILSTAAINTNYMSIADAIIYSIYF